MVLVTIWVVHQGCDLNPARARFDKTRHSGFAEIKLNS
jgi:hypothetical protein